MTEPSRFCTNCGKPLAPGARFCGVCGAAVQAVPSQVGPSQPAARTPTGQPPQAPASITQPPSQAQPSEIILGLIPGLSRSRGLMGLKQEAFTLVLTNARMLFAVYNNRTVGKSVKLVREQAKAQGKGFFGQWGAQMSAMGMPHYLTMTPAQIMAEEQGNFYVPLTQVRSVRFSEASDDESAATYYYIEIETTGEKFKFRSTMDIKSMQKVLQPVLGNRI